MSKYTEKELKEKAQDFLLAYRQGDQRAIFLLQFLQQAFRMQQEQIFKEIAKLADLEE